MKNLLYILLVLLIASCKSPTAPDNEFEPYIVGNFKIVALNEAEYIGEQSNQKVIHASGDTVEIKQPGQRSLTMWRDTTAPKNQFMMEFVDSTINEGIADNNNMGEPVFDNPEGHSAYPIFSNGHSTLLTGDYMKSKFYMSYNRDQEFVSKSPIIFIKYPTKDNGIFRVYAIHVSGIERTIRDILSE